MRGYTIPLKYFGGIVANESSRPQIYFDPYIIKISCDDPAIFIRWDLNDRDFIPDIIKNLVIVWNDLTTNMNRITGYPFTQVKLEFLEVVFFNSSGDTYYDNTRFIMLGKAMYPSETGDMEEYMWKNDGDAGDINSSISRILYNQFSKLSIVMNK